jgi:FAD/FMN-containing dehydrogenase
MACHARSRVYRPTGPEEVADALGDARRRGLTVVHRGAGLSYGDAALNQGGATLLTTGLSGVGAVDPETGVVRAGAGATVGQLWRAALPLGWWPPVVPGTMEVTLGGAVAMNVHGKNQFTRGSFGEHVEALDVVRADGSLERLSAAGSGERLREVIGAQGLNGTVTDVTLRLKRVPSGLLEVDSITTESVDETLDVLEERAPTSEYSVGWVDGFPAGARAGRGLLHFARDLPADHPRIGRDLSLDAQILPTRLFGILPRSQAWRILSAFTHDPGMRWVNAGRFWAGRVRHGHRYLQTHAAFHFLLDYMPGWKRVYAPHGLLQYQLFVPREAARRAFSEALRLQRKNGLWSYLGVVKRHRADDFDATYSVDGFSLALDLPVDPRRLDRLVALCRSYDDLLRDVGGRIYAAKDAVGRGTLPEARDPLFSSNLVRRWEAAEEG